jgi:ribonuclease PH
VVEILTTDGNNFSARSAKLSGASLALVVAEIIVITTKTTSAIAIVEKREIGIFVKLANGFLFKG